MIHVNTLNTTEAWRNLHSHIYTSMAWYRYFIADETTTHRLVGMEILSWINVLLKNIKYMLDERNDQLNKKGQISPLKVRPDKKVKHGREVDSVNASSR